MGIRSSPEYRPLRPAERRARPPDIEQSHVRPTWPERITRSERISRAEVSPARETPHVPSELGIEGAEPGEGDEVDDELDPVAGAPELDIEGAHPRESVTARVERVEPAAADTEAPAPGWTPPASGWTPPASGWTPPSAERDAKTSRPQVPVEVAPRVATEEPALSTIHRFVEWESETPLSFSARERFASIPGANKVRELEAAFDPVDISRVRTGPLPRREAARSLTTPEDVDFFKPRVQALMADSGEREAAQEIWTRAATIVVPAITLDNQRQALREGLLRWVQNEPEQRTAEASRKQPGIVGWFFDMVREVVIAVAKEALVELLLPGVHLIIPPTGIVDAVLTACTMLEIADAA